ncbi:MAG: hypothetical protein ACYCPR_02495 [Thermoplasmataceae archaeon]
MTFLLKHLGPYRIERSEEYILGGSDNSYAEMIRVRGSKPEPPYFMTPSHLYKYSETELGVYLKERKNLWGPLGKVLGERNDVHEAELMVHFPISKFNEIAALVPFVKKAIRKIPMSESERRERGERLASFRSQRSRGSEQKEPKPVMKDTHRAITLETFGGDT